MNDRELLGVAIAVALVFATGWLWRAAGDDVTDRALVPVGAAAAVKGVDYRLRSLTSGERVGTGSDRHSSPSAAPCWSLPRWTTTPPELPEVCSAVSRSWPGRRPESGVRLLPTWGRLGFLRSRQGGTVSALFEVPRAFLAQVQGVGVINPEGTEPILPGRPG